MATRLIGIIAMSVMFGVLSASDPRAEPGDAPRCHVLPAWSAHLAKEVAIVHRKYPTDAQLLCSVSSMANHRPGTRFAMATVIDMHAACGQGTADCSYTASQMAFLVERVFLMHSYATRHGCLMPPVPHPCQFYGAALDRRWGYP